MIIKRELQISSNRHQLIRPKSQIVVHGRIGNISYKINIDLWVHTAQGYRRVEVYLHLSIPTLHRDATVS